MTSSYAMWHNVYIWKLKQIIRFVLTQINLVTKVVTLYCNYYKIYNNLICLISNISFNEYAICIFIKFC